VKAEGSIEQFPVDRGAGIVSSKQYWLCLVSVFVVFGVYVIWSLNVRMVPLALGYSTVVIDSRTKSFGAARESDRKSVAFRLTNRGHSQVRIVGCQLSCACTTTEELPFSISPQQTKDFNLTINLSGKSGRVAIPFSILTSDPAQPSIDCTITGQVSPNG